MRPAVYGTDGQGLERVWRTAILPLLEEHHYGDRTVDVRARTGSTLSGSWYRRRLLPRRNRPLSRRIQSQPRQKRSMMASPPLILTEGDSPQTVALAEAEYQALQQLALVNVTPTLVHGLYDMAASRKVGAVAIGERQVIVRPKITDLNRLLFLLGYAKGSRHLAQRLGRSHCRRPADSGSRGGVRPDRIDRRRAGSAFWDTGRGTVKLIGGLGDSGLSFACCA